VLKKCNNDINQFAETINWTDPFYEEEGFFKNPSMEEALAVYKNYFTFLEQACYF
jgi:hypothetical protein